MNGIIPNVAFKYDKDARLYIIDYEENDISETEKHSTQPEDIQKVVSAISATKTNVIIIKMVDGAWLAKSTIMKHNSLNYLDSLR